jgi:amino acid permease
LCDTSFLGSYFPAHFVSRQPIFLLLVFGYKLLRQTTMVKVADMRFTRGDLAEEDDEDDELPKKGWKRFWNWII